jgi:hypothetical protein
VFVLHCFVCVTENTISCFRVGSAVFKSQFTLWKTLMDYLYSLLFFRNCTFWFTEVTIVYLLVYVSRKYMLLLRR